MKAQSFCVLAAITLTMLASQAFAQTPELKEDLRNSFSRVNVSRIDPGAEPRNQGGSRTIKLRAEGRDFDLVVTPNDIRSPRYRAEDTNMVGVSTLSAPPVKTYKGHIAGEEGSEVRLTIDGPKVEGFFQGANGRLFIEPAGKYSRFAQRGDAVIYRAEDSLKDNSFVCDADIAAKIEFGQEMTQAAQLGAASMLRVFEIATEADLEWVNTLGGAANANAEIISILNMVEGTYAAELNLSIDVVYQHTWSTADPFGAADMNGILTSFQSHWNANYGSVQRDAAHLFTAKTVAQSRGLAYVGVICRAPSAAYGLSGYISWAPGKFLVPAHELGHNLGADHVEAAQSCGNTLMNATLTGSTPLSFCTMSRDTIGTFVSTNGSCLTEASAATEACFDFDGDRRSDISVFRPSNGVWYLNRSSSGFSSFQFGLTGDKPVAADYDGDGRSDPAVFRAGVWYRLLSTTNTMDAITFGLLGDIPAPADLDGDGRSDVVVFRPATGVWHSLASGNGSYSSVRFGLAGDVPMPGDYDGDSRADINIFRPSNGTWYRINSSNGSNFAMNFGLNGDKPVSGDFDGDARYDVAVWRPSNGVWYVIRSSTGSFSATAFGLNGDLPTAADYDGDGKADIAVFRPSNGVWYRLNSGNGAFSAVAFGLAGDDPVPSYYVQ